MGTPTQHIVSIGEIHRGFRNWDLQFFAGDRWRVKPNLTLNFSLRYEPITTPREGFEGRNTAHGCVGQDLIREPERSRKRRFRLPMSIYILEEDAEHMFEVWTWPQAVVSFQSQL